MAMTDRQILDLILGTECYRKLDAVEKEKVRKAMQGLPANTPRSNIAKAAFALARRIWPVQTPPPPPPPPPPFKKVAPITVRQEGGSDQRVCLRWPDGTLRPGVFQRDDGTYGDESNAVYNRDGDGLEDSSVRTKVDDPRLVGARSMDNRSACECPTVGSPENNTGSWTV